MAPMVGAGDELVYFRPPPAQFYPLSIVRRPVNRGAAGWPFI